MSTDFPQNWLESLEGVRPTTLEYRDVTPFTFLKERAENYSNDPCMIFPKGSTLSYAETLTSVKQLAVKLTKLGVVKGDRVLLLLGNTPHYVIGHFAILAIGAVIVQGNPIYTKRELVDQTKDSGAKGMITITLFQEKANEVMAETDLEFIICGTISEYLKPIVAFLGKYVLRKLQDPKMKSLPNNYHYSSIESENISEFVETDVDLDDIAILQYTGGTTGPAKGAMLTHRNISYNAQQTRSLVHMVPERIGSVLTILPLFHSFALTVCMGVSFQMGAPMVLMPKFDAGEALANVEKYGVTFLPGVPTMMIAILNHKDILKRDLSSLIASFSGGAALPVEVAAKFHEITGGDLVEGYGLSETTPVVTANPVMSDKLKPMRGSIGLPVADTWLKIVDQDDQTKDLAVGEVGEIAIKGYQVMKGYWKNEEDTKKVMNEDGWFFSGDIGRMDEQGYFYIVDRKKDIIIVSGNNVVPREIEEVLYTHPAVLEAAVAGLKHDTKGEMVAAWIVLKEGKTATVEEIIAFCKENLAPYKIPKQVEFRTDLPKTMIGKILKRKLQEEYD